MPVFSYTALRADSSLTQGSVAADTSRQALDQLRTRGLVVQEIRVTSDGSSWRRGPWFGRRRYKRELGSAIRELATLLSAGIPVLESLDTLVAQCKRD